MWPFKRTPPAKTGPEPVPDAILALPGQVQALEKRWEEIEYEWNDWYEKFRRLHARLARREARAKQEGDSPDGHDADPLAAARAALIQRKISRG